MVIDQGQVSVTDLAKATGVSEVTIRQDLNTLEKLSYLRRAHGFAVSLDSDDVETRMMSNYTLKRELAEFAASLVQPGETIFIENGNSTMPCSPGLWANRRRSVTIITVSSYIAHLLKDAPGEVILLGGVYQKKSESMVGPLTRQCIQQVHFSKAFIGIDGWQPETGFTGREMTRTDVVHAVLEKECEAIVLTDSSKFGAVHSYSIGPV
ncbi:DNA-binding transcriptional regulator YciT [Escherichia coli]